MTHKMRLLVWSLELDFEDLLLPPYSSYTGCQFNIASHSNYASLFIKFTINRHHHTSVIKLSQMPTCDPAPDCVLPVPRNIRYQGHVLSLASEVFFAGTAAWNTLPHYVHDITDSAVFKRHLKSVLFRRARLDSL